MRTQAYHLSFTRFSPNLSVQRFSATEAVNQPYQIEVWFTCANADLPLASYINQQVRFTVLPESGALAALDALYAPEPLKVWNGIVTHCEKVSVSADETVYRLLMAPRLAALAHHRTSRLFQNQTVPDIIAAVLKHHGLSGVDFRIHQSRSYALREYVTQYQESDLDFIKRLCEEEGIWFVFEQHEQNGDVVVFGDSTAHYLRTPTTTAAYRPHAGLESVGEEALFDLRVKHNPILESIRVGDYNYRDADTDLSHKQDNRAEDASVLLGSDTHWGLHQKTPEEAAVQTGLLQELNLCRRIEAAGSGNITPLCPGKVFQTSPSFNEAPDGWLVLSISHSGSRDEAYTHHFTAIPAEVVFRPERVTPQPSIRGSLPARVTSPGNYTYAYIDEMGRYRVKLPFDLDEWSPGGESRPVRLAKSYAGPDYGNHFPLHEGTEVMLSFVQGNPDRPYISGVMHDSSHPDHVPADWNTRNVIRTWANNKLRMEDKQGQEHIKLATEYGKTQLNLGHIVDSSRKKRGDNGEGFELRTDSWGAVRAGKGLLITTEQQEKAAGQTLEMSETVKRLEEALALAKQLDDAAKRAKNTATESPAQRNQLNNALQQLKQAGIILSAPAGIAATTPQSQLYAAGSHIHWVSGGDSNISAAKNFTAHAQESLNLFAQSKGMQIQANQGAVIVQAQNDRMQVNALKDLELSSSSTKVTVAGKQEVMISGGGGSYIQLKDGEIILGSPKIVRVKAPSMPVGGGDSFNFSGFPLTDKICIPCKIAELTGKPVNPISGIKVLPDETDFSFDGLVPLVWSRSYYSDLTEAGWLGSGWSTPLSARLERRDGGFSYTDTQGRRFALPELSESDGQLLFEAEQIIFERIDNGSYQISSLDGNSKLRFSPLHLNHEDRLGGGNGVYPLTRVSDRLDNDYRIVYDERGLPAYVIDSLKRIIRFGFTEVGHPDHPLSRLSHIALQKGALPDDDADETLVAYRYDDEGRLAEVYDGRGRLQRQFGYTGAVMTRHRNAAGLTAYYEYDRYAADGKVVRSYTDAGEEWRFAYADGHSQITDALGRSEHLYFDHNGEVVKKVFADGSSILTERDALGRPVKMTDEMGRETRYRYNEQGLLVFIGGEGGQNQHIRYNQNRQPVEIIRPHGQKTLLEYDGNGLLLKQSDGKGHSTAYRYNAYGQPVQITDAKNNGYFFEYDANHRLSSSTDCSGKQTRYAYDDKGRTSSITDAAGGVTAYRYNEDGQLYSTVYPDGSAEFYRYDEAGRLHSHTDADGNQTAYAYNLDNQPVERTNALGDTFRYRYDAARRLSELVNENGDVYRFRYDERDRLISETGFDGKTTGYTYNPAGDLVQEKRYGVHSATLLQTTVYHRDRSGRISQKDSHWAENSRSESSRYFYDKLNRLTRAFNDHSEIRLSYTADGLLAKEQFRPLSEPIRLDILQPRNTEGEKVTEYRYDVLGNRIQTILPSGETLNYLYYGSGHLHHINLDGDTLSDIERDDLHRPISRSAGKLHSRFELDPLGRLKQQLAELQPEHKQPETLIGRRYQYDKVGNLTRTEDQRSGHKDYAYDPLGRITAAGDERFAFDPAHNIVSDRHSALPVKGNRLTEYHGTRYVYDGLGNLSEQHDDDGSRYYRYDADNQLIEARIEKAGKPAEVWQYRYDALGRRISKASLNRKTEFIWEGSRLLQEYAPNGVYSYVYTEQGSYEPLAQIFKANGATQNEILYYHNDQIGIPRELTDADGNIVWSGEYSGWGKLTNPDNACLKKGVHQPFRLQNQYADEETGLHYNFFRYYDPHCGRFTQQDPIKLLGDTNFYNLGTNISTQFDPLGLDVVIKGIDTKIGAEPYSYNIEANQCWFSWAETGAAKLLKRNVPITKAASTPYSVIDSLRGKGVTLKLDCEQQNAFKRSLDSAIEKGQFPSCKGGFRVDGIAACVKDSELKQFLESIKNQKVYQGKINPQQVIDELHKNIDNSPYSKARNAMW